MGINEYENVSGGWVGVKIKDDTRRTGYRGHPVPPFGRVLLSEEERVATANAPRKPEDNPFVNGHLRLIATDQTQATRRPIGDGEPQAPEPEPKPPQQPEAEAPAGQKPESEMTQEEINAHNAKVAAARAVPAKEPPEPPPAPETAAKGAPKSKVQEEIVGTPEATAAAGEKPEGKRAAGEHVGTPSALKK